MSDECPGEVDYELKTGSDGVSRRPCDDCGSADESSLVKAERSSLYLCDDCRRRIAESAEVLFN